jgi:hypothetical protein
MDMPKEAIAGFVKLLRRLADEVERGESKLEAFDFERGLESHWGQGGECFPADILDNGKRTLKIVYHMPGKRDPRLT